MNARVAPAHVREGEVLLVAFRHGQTDWNAQNRIQGSTDVPLNESGRAQARALAERLALALAPARLDHVLSSPLERASETARIVAAHHGAGVTFESDLREVWFGAAEGRTREELVSAHGEDFWARWRSCAHEHMRFSFLAGEAKCDARDRALAVLRRHGRATPHGVLGVSTHGGILRFLVHSVATGLEAPVPMENCAAYLFAYAVEDDAFRYLGPG